MSEEALQPTEIIEPGQEVAPAQSQAKVATLWRTDDPVEILQRAKATADALAPVIREANLVSNINGKDFLNVEAWQTLGQQVGVTPVIVETRRLSEPDGWEARCEARTLDGRTIGAADSMCLKNEVDGKGKQRWNDANEFEIRSMAQTRAMSRALASVLRFIPTLAGMGGTPAEEMDRVATQGGNGSKGGGKRKPSEAQRNLVERLLGESSLEPEQANQVYAWAETELTGGRDGSMSELIDGLMKDKDAKAAEVLPTAQEWASKQSDVPDDGGDDSNQGKSDEDIPF